MPLNVIRRQLQNRAEVNFTSTQYSASAPHENYVVVVARRRSGCGHHRLKDGHVDRQGNVIVVNAVLHVHLLQRFRIRGDSI